MRKFFVLMAALMLLLSSAALAESQTAPQFATLREALDAAGRFSIVGGDWDHMVAAIEKDGQYFRVVTELDDRAHELNDAISTAEDIGAAFEAYDAYVYALPVSYTEVLTEQPMTQEEVETLTGKTIGELQAEGYDYGGSGTEGTEEDPDRIVFWMDRGLFSYTLPVVATFEQYEAAQAKDDFSSLVVRSGGELENFSGHATDLSYQADGTVKTEEEQKPETQQPSAEVNEIARDAVERFLDSILNRKN